MSLYLAHLRQQALTAATAKTLIQLVTPATCRARVVEVGVSFRGVTATDPPVTIDLLRQTTAGTMTAFTPVLWDPAATAADCTAQNNATVEPTAGDILSSWEVTPVGGLFVVQYPLDDEPVVGASGRVGLRATPGSAIAADATVSAYVRWREIG